MRPTRVLAVATLTFAALSQILALDGTCESVSCSNGGTCNDTARMTSSCTCPEGFIGELCQGNFSITALSNVIVGTIETPVHLSVTVLSPDGTNPTVKVVTPSSAKENLSASDTLFVHTIANTDFTHVGNYSFTATVNYNGSEYSISTDIGIVYVLTVGIMTDMPADNYFKQGKTDVKLEATVSTESDLSNVAVTVLPPSGIAIDAIAENELPSGSKEFTHTIAGGDGVTAETDSGNYVFTATETYDGKSRSVNVSISVTIEVPASTPKIAPSNPIVVREMSHTIECSSTGIPEPSITWHYNMESVSNDTSSVIYQENGNLVFTVATPFDAAGIYTCRATNTLQSTGEQIADDTIDIIVEGAPEFVMATTPKTMESLSLTCTFDAVPEPTITWGWKDGKEIPTDSIFMNTSTTAEGGPSYRSTSMLNIEHSSLCLGPQTITCHATNSRSETTATIDINQDDYGVHLNKYYIFPIESKSYDEAEMHCISLDGHLAYIQSSEVQTAVTAIAEEFANTGFYIGAKYDQVDSQWKWTDGTPVSNTNWTDTLSSSSGCAYIEKTDSTWAWRAITCSDIQKFACEIEATKAPSALHANFQECDGTRGTFDWKADGYFQQQIEIGTADTSDIPALGNHYQSTKLTKGTEYYVKVSTGYDVCDRHPFAEDNFRTASPKASQPIIVSFEYVNSICKLQWEYPENLKYEVDNFQVAITESIRVGTSTDERNEFNVPDSEREFPITTKPNSIYTATIQTLSCVGNSDVLTVPGNCTTDPEVPSNIPQIDIQSTETTLSNGIPFQFKSFSERNGPVGCVLCVARWRRTGNAFANADITEEILNSLKTKNNNVNENESYLMFALENENQNKTIGVGNEMTSCPTTTKKRAVTSLDSYQALNRRLITGAKYQFYLIAATLSNGEYRFSNSEWSSTVVINADPVSTPPVVAIVVPILVILLLIILLILFIFWWRKRKQLKRLESTYNDSAMRNNAHNNPAFSDATTYENAPRDRSIAVENLRSTYQTKHADEDRLFREEYRALATEVSELMIHFNYAMALEVRDKNRFSNIHPANETRVVLRRRGTDIYSDYINASYLDGYRHPRKFIAAQGPLDTTIGDFWYMIWEQESSVIVMLTKVDEGGRRKCEKYWPDDKEQRTFENLIVQSLTTVAYGCIVKRTFQVSNPNQSEKKLMVDQFQFLSWPDHGVPITTSPIFNLRRMVIESQGNNPSPIVVHCSAGVGRTGTFVALDYLCHQMERESKVDIYGTVFAMRKKRKEMVQTVEQYSLLHKLMLEKHLFGTTDTINSNFLNTFGSGEYEMVDEIEEGYFNLSIVPPITALKCSPESERIKIRDPEIVPYEHCKVVIRMRPNEEKASFINASYIQTYNASDAFIACQGPVASSIEDFWRVVLDNNVTVIVMLSQLEENGKEQCSQYWPQNSESPCIFGDIMISLSSETQADGYTERWLQVSEKVLHLRRSLNVLQLHYEKWPDCSVPRDASSLLDLISKTQASRQTTQGTSPVLVHCSDGAGRTGTFCAIVNLIERLKNEDRIDVFRTVKDLRDMRPLMVKSLEQYRFCYKALQEYLDSFDLYANFK